ncbi:MAG: zinc ribbon domain-containing protein [Oscillospiraceae bacterium]|jgi:hypothetical protein|nr:zinc ribbon domain-containing protein [Oscillospiraceae bacterium]
MICENCHQPVRDGAWYCPHCGLPIQAAPPPREAAPPPYEPRQIWEAPRAVWTADHRAAPAVPHPVWPPAFGQTESGGAQSAVAQKTEDTREQETAPKILSAAWLVGHFFLMLVPFVNLICACVWSFGRRTDAQRRALARASLIVLLLIWVVSAGLVYVAVVYRLPQVNALLDILFGPM